MSTLFAPTLSALDTALTTPGAAANVKEILEFVGGPGTHFYVSSVIGAANNDGRTPQTPFATIAQAMAECTASKRDTIYLLPGHTETYSTTGSKLTVKAGVNIISVGQGADRGTFTFSHVDATWTISGAGARIENVLFVTGVDLVKTFATISGADVSLVNCETRDALDVETIDTFIVTGARFTAIDHFHNGYTGGDANARVFKMTGVARALIQGCRFITKVTTGVVNFATTACTGVVVRGCTFLVTGTSNGTKNVVDTITGSTFSIEHSVDMSAGSGAMISSADASDIQSTVVSAGVVIATANSSGLSATVSLGVINSTQASTNLSGTVSVGTANSTAHSILLSTMNSHFVVTKSKIDSVGAL